MDGLKWMRPAGAAGQAEMVYYRLRIGDAKAAGKIDFEFSADETAQIFLDGELVTAGPERGSAERWYRQHCSLEIAPGSHWLVARVLSFGNARTAHAQMSVRHGFCCSLQGAWECFPAEKVSFQAPWPDWGVFPRMTAEQGFNYLAQAGGGEGWQPVEYFRDDRELHARELPELIGPEVRDYEQKDGMLVFKDYQCLWPTWTFSGEGTVAVRWSETGYLTSMFSRHTLKGEKGRRDGRFHVGKWDVYDVHGGTVFTDIQWRAGRYVEIQCTGTARVEKVCFRQAGFPYQFRLQPEAMPENERNIVRMAMKTLCCCSHDTFMDCPFYERLMYIGDARIEALCAYAAAGEDRLARKALRMFALSQKEDGAILSRYPARVEQMIPSFVAIFILMLHDFMVWRGDRDFVEELLPAARRVADYLMKSRSKDGLCYPEGWNFIDWQWPDHGVPYGSECGTNAVINLMIDLAVFRMAELEDFAGSKAKAADLKQWAESLFTAVKEVYYDEDRKLIATDKEHRFYAEHSQVLALLIQDLPQLWQGLEEAADLTPCGIYFSHYYLQACRIHGQWRLFDEKLRKWHELEELGLKTLPEDFVQPRSDCHAWSSHVIYHLMLRYGMAEPCLPENRLCL